MRLTLSTRVRHASSIQSAKTMAALNWNAASAHAWTVPKASVVVTTARQSMRMMKRLQTVRGSSRAAAVARRARRGRDGGGGGGGGGAVARSARVSHARLRVRG